MIKTIVWKKLILRYTMTTVLAIGLDGMKPFSNMVYKIMILILNLERDSEMGG